MMKSDSKVPEEGISGPKENEHDIDTFKDITSQSQLKQECINSGVSHLSLSEQDHNAQNKRVRFSECVINLEELGKRPCFEGDIREGHEAKNALSTKKYGSSSSSTDQSKTHTLSLSSLQLNNVYSKLETLEEPVNADSKTMKGTELM